MSNPTSGHTGQSFFRPSSIQRSMGIPAPLLPEGEVHADGVTIPVAPPAAPPAPVFTEADIQKARQQEKDKVYGRVEQAEKLAREAAEQIRSLQETKDAEIAAAAKKAREEAQAAAKAAFEEADSKGQIDIVRREFEERLAQQQQQFLTLQQQAEQERATFQREQEFQALKGYAQQVVQAALSEGAVAPELADLVTGNNREEIDASLENVKQRTQLLVQNMRQAMAQTRAGMPGVSPTGAAPVGPLETEGSTRTLSATDIGSMSMAEYAQHRGSLLGAASQAQQGRGLYG